MTGSFLSNNTDGNVLVNPSNSFHLHHSDHPGIVLVTKPLNGDNYGTWNRSMSIALSAKNKTGFIDGSIQKPSSTNKNFSSWKRCNDMVLSWILNSVESDPANSVIYAETAAKVWRDLKERFSQNNAPRLFQIERDIASLQQGSLSVAAYFTKLKGLWDELSSYNDLPVCSCGAIKKVEEREQRGKVMQFLMGLNESYSAIRGQILLMQPLPVVGRVYSMVLNEEKQRDLVVSKEVMIEAARRNYSGNNSSNKAKGKLHCNHCNGNNHTIDRCFHLHGFPPGHKYHKRNQQEGGKKESYANNS